MAQTSKPPALRQLGGMELFSSTRHHLGIYRCVIVSARYQIASSHQNSHPEVIETILLAALATIVREEPVLRVGILDQDTGSATFSHLEEVNLRDHFELRTLQDCDTRDQYELRLAETQGWLHDQLWSHIETRAPWKVLVLRPKDGIFSSDPPICDVFFAYHHSLTDGTGGKQFHRRLLEALNAPQASTPSLTQEYVLSFPEPPKLPEDQYQVIPFKITFPFLLRTLWNLFAPWFLKPRPIPIWAGKKMDFSLPYKTRVLSVDFPPEVVASLLQSAREHSSTLTTVIHAMILASISRRTCTENTSFICSTPINLRPWMSAKTDVSTREKLRVAITAFNIAHPPSVIDSFRSPESNVDSLIWESSKRIKEQLNIRTSTIPIDDVSGLIPQISDFFKYWTKKDGMDRDMTWEVSNIGVLDGDSECAESVESADGSDWRAVRSVFTNGAMVAGPAISINVLSIKGGPLTISISWQDTVVEENVIRGIASDLQVFANSLSRLKKPDIQ